MKKTSKRYEIEKFWYEIASQKVWKYTHWRYETTLKRYEMMSKVWKNTNDTKVWNRCTRYERQHKVWKMCPRYEKCAQGIKQTLKVMKWCFKVWNMFFLEKQWVFIPLWVCFIPLWVWKKSLFFPDESLSRSTWYMIWRAAIMWTLWSTDSVRYIWLWNIFDW